MLGYNAIFLKPYHSLHSMTFLRIFNNSNINKLTSNEIQEMSETEDNYATDSTLDSKSDIEHDSDMEYESDNSTNYK